MVRKHWSLSLASLSVVVISTMAAASIVVSTVPVGDAGNTADTAVMLRDNSTGYGRVTYTYSIGKYEVTAGQYAAFLNAVGATDAYSLYNTSMSNTSYGSGITRSGSSGSYTYSVAAAFVNRPVNYVSFWDSIRFANWLHNGQPTGAQDNSTTENGAYTITSDGITNNTITRNSGWKWAVASENEWYKAAYYKAGSTNAGYWLYATQSNSDPGRDMTDASGNNANYRPSGATPYPIDSGKYTTVAGEFQASESAYNTLDQAGNIQEWNEARLATSARGLRGGYYEPGAAAMASTAQNISAPGTEASSIGFRVTQVPTPTAVVMSMLGLAGLAVRRRRSAR